MGAVWDSKARDSNYYAKAATIPVDEQPKQVENVKSQDVAKVEKALKMLVLQPWLHPMQHKAEGAIEPSSRVMGREIEEMTEVVLQTTRERSEGV